MGKRRYPKLTADQEHAMRKAVDVQRASDGSYTARASSRTELEAGVAAAKDADCDVSVFLSGLDAQTLALCAQEVCDLAIDQGVTVRFHHRGQVLRLAVDHDLPATVREPI